MLSIEPFGGTANIDSKSLSYAVNEVSSIETHDDVNHIISDIEAGVSELNDAETSLAEASNHIESLEDVIATLLSTIENVRDICSDPERDLVKEDVMDATDLSDSHPLALSQEVYLSSILSNRKGDPLGMLKEYIPVMDNFPHGHKLKKGKINVLYAFDRWMGNTVKTITYENLTFYSAYVKDHTANSLTYYSGHFEDPSKPTDAEIILWTLSTGLKYLPGILKETQNEF